MAKTESSNLMVTHFTHMVSPSPFAILEVALNPDFTKMGLRVRLSVELKVTQQNREIPASFL